MRIVAEVLGLIVFIDVAALILDRALLVRKLVDLVILEQHVIECLAGILGHLRNQLFAPRLLDRKTLGKLHHLPQIRTRVTGSPDLLAPELGATLGVAVGALFFSPHRCRQNQVGAHRRDRRIGIGDGDKVGRIAPAGPGFFIEVG